MVDFKNTLSVYQKMINDGLKNIYLNGPNYIKEPKKQSDMKHLLSLIYQEKVTMG